jgi:hypothetical protein
MGSEELPFLVLAECLGLLHVAVNITAGLVPLGVGRGHYRLEF